MKRKEEAKGRFNVLDLFLLFLTVLSVVAILLRQQAPKKDQREALALEVTLRVQGLRKETLSCLSAGDLLYTAAGEYFGSVTQAEASVADVSLFSSGVFYSGVPEGAELFNLTVRVSVWGNQSGDVFLQDGKLPLLLGKELALYSELVALRAKVTEVREITG